MTTLLLACLPMPPHMDAPQADAPEAESADEAWDRSLDTSDVVHDVIVIGGGPAGLATAAELDHGLLLEAESPVGGRIKWASGPELMLVGTIEQVLHGYNDSPEAAAKNWATVQGDAPSELTWRFLEESAEVRNRLLGLGLSFERLSRTPTSVVPRQHHIAESGWDFVAAIASEIDIEIRTDTWVEDLVIEDGAVRGVMVDGELIRARRVVIATGGVISDPDLLDELGYAPEQFSVEIGGDELNWIAHDWALDHDLAESQLDAIGWHPGHAAYEDGPRRLEANDGSAIWVDEHGERFFNEVRSTSVEAGGAILRRDVTGIVSCEETLEPMLFKDAGYLEQFETVDDLAEAHDFDAESLRQSLADVRDHHHNGGMDSTGRSIWPSEMMLPLCTFEPGFTASKAYGGIDVDDQGRVLDVTGTPVQGLYAVGEAAGMGQPGLGGWYGFDGSMSAVVWSGWRVGADLAAR
ncbi:MAG: FAD-binding protein [Proteobacteria bacterium]|nr:FAD-binding protein [Pseudomonadota bacterium]